MGALGYPELNSQQNYQLYCDAVFSFRNAVKDGAPEQDAFMEALHGHSLTNHYADLFKSQIAKRHPEINTNPSGGGL